ncbi:hypothetical protein [Hyphomonas johnsonii]|jgi:hypothetical protein|uniref:Uncharacterized protein n=1 Tax=Hyphomonas johnsonii MHS-2 TaxID=1280950 RepID=A0A059F9R0_9PROT|nr:hypothetical protein [Hyphomonas johnsonii]KCZ87337.1 hypothetical protein HJO_16862 [Hyphomonas johnsonii MHS-2]
MALKRITIQLARNPGLPGGDPGQGYTIIAPLTAEGLLDVEAWRDVRKQCRVVRFSPDESEVADGWLTHHGSHWYFHYDEDDEGDDEAGYRLGEHVFKEGEYVTVASHGETPLTYKVTDVSPV